MEEIMKKVCSFCRKEVKKYRYRNMIFCSHSCYWKWLKGKRSNRKGMKQPQSWGEKNPAWKNGKTINSDGYIILHIKGEIFLEHRYIMEQYLGRKLDKLEVVHHKDQNKANNDLNNLEVLPWGEHSRLHHTKGAYA